jgi:TonB-linked SusC/RagA family outer membrane protein
MTNLVLKHVLYMTKLCTYAFLLQCIFMNFLFANNGNAQVKSIEEIKVQMTLENEPIENAFRKIERMSNLSFVYTNKDVRDTPRISLEDKSMSVYEVLTEISLQTKLEFKQINRSILVQTSKKPTIEEAMVLVDQDVTVTGVVMDREGQPIPGVTVSAQVGSIGTATDLSGRYSLTVPEGSTLVFSFVGFEAQSILIGERTVLNVTLLEDMASLDEVVVVGYGEQKKANITGSIVDVGGQALEKSPSISISNSLAGRLPGVVALNRSGEPGDDFSSILIRGRNTLGNNNPLIVIDGVPGRDGINQIDPRDVESVSVLKDASAAIYGAQAANGVILITTKRGTTSKPVISYSFNQGFTQPTRLMEMADSESYAKVYNDLLNTMGQPARFSKEEIQKFRDGSDPLNYPNTNWVDEVLRPYSTQSRHSLSLRGGSENIRYYLSSNYSNQEGIFKNGIHNYKIMGFRSNIDANVTRDLKLSFDFSLQQSDRRRPGAATSTIINSTWRNYPFIHAYYPNGLPGLGIERGENPVILPTEQTGTRDNKNHNYFTKLAFELFVPQVEGLSVDGFLSYDKSHNYQKNWNTPWILYNYDPATDGYNEVVSGPYIKPRLMEQYDGAYALILNGRLKYERTFDKHFFNAFVAFEQAQGKANWFNGERRDFPLDVLPELFVGPDDMQFTRGSSTEYARRNYFGRISYNYSEKYLLDMNFRYDGSYRFPKNSRFGFFPGLSLGWKLSEESFFQEWSSSFSLLKLRASWGQMGNDAVSPFQYLAVYNLASGGVFGDNLNPSLGISRGVSPNANITWEVANTSNIGFDAEVLEGRFGFSFDFFRSHRSNILATRNLSVPIYTSLVLPDENIGEVENKGFEIVLSHSNTKNNLTYNISGNVAFAKNKVLNIDESVDVPEWQKLTGLPLGSSLYYLSDGIYRTSEELTQHPTHSLTGLGEMIYKDQNGDDAITAADRVRLPKTNTPEVTFGLSFYVGYKDFDMSGLFQGQARAWQYIYQFTGLGGNVLQDLADSRWTPENPDAKYPIIQSYYVYSEGNETDFWLKDASFIRLKNIEVGYQMPATLYERIGLKGLRLYVSGVNLLTWDKLKWTDPEGTSNTGAFYPQNKIYNLGINVTL